MVLFDELFEWTSEGNMWSNLISEDEREEDFSKVGISRHEEVFLKGGHFFSENRSRQALLFNLKKRMIIRD